MPFLFQPLPHTEARGRIAGLPLVTREMMDNMLPELRAYAFTLTGLDVGDQMARVRDELAAVPMGAKTWAEAKKTIAADLKDKLGGKESQRRAELLLRTHVFRGYAAARYRALMAQIDIFPYWQYKTHGDGNVRPSHAALNGKIFPAGHDIWQQIFPPWDWGCRCLVVPLTAGQVGRMQDAGMPSNKDASLLPTQIAKPEVFTAREADLINQSKKLPGGISLDHAPTWSAAPWSTPGNIRHDWPLIEARYGDQPEVLAAFKDWAAKAEMPSTGTSVHGWISGDSVNADARWPAVKAPEWVDEKEVLAWRAKLKASAVINPVSAKEALSWESLNKQTLGPISQHKVNRAAQSLLDLLPPEVVQACGPLKVDVVSDLGSAFGKYDHSESRLTLSHAAAEGTEMDLRARIWHEYAHHLYLNADKHPKLKQWRARIEDHWQTRTAKEPLETSDEGWQFLRDEWIDVYAGRLYKSHSPGVEISSVYLEQMAHGPEAIAGWAAKDAWKETFDIVSSIFSQP